MGGCVCVSGCAFSGTSARTHDQGSYVEGELQGRAQLHAQNSAWKSFEGLSSPGVFETGSSYWKSCTHRKAQPRPTCTELLLSWRVCPLKGILAEPGGVESHSLGLKSSKEEEWCVDSLPGDF